MRLPSFVFALGLIVSSLSLADATVGKPAPDFTAISGLNGKKNVESKLADFKGKFVVLEWFNAGCPFVRKHYDTNNMQKLQKTYTDKGVAWLTVISSAEKKEGYIAPAQITETMTKEKMASTKLLLDPKGKMGKDYGAKTTPHMYIIDPKGILIYAGAIDDKSTTDNADVGIAKNYVSAALDEALAGKPVTMATSKAYGCSVKYP